MFTLVASGFSRTVFTLVASGFSRTMSTFVASGFSRTMSTFVASGFSRTVWTLRRIERPCRASEPADRLSKAGVHVAEEAGLCAAAWEVGDEGVGLPACGPRQRVEAAVAAVGDLLREGP